MARKKGSARLLVAPKYKTDKRAIILVRVSEGRDRGHKRISEEEQVRACRGLAEAKGLTVVVVFYEIGVSGDSQREKLDEALAMIENREAAWLIVNEVDRLGRGGILDAAEAMERIAQAGGCLLINDPLLESSSEAGRLIITILAQLAYSERMKITRKWANAQESAWRRGYFPGDLPCGLRNPTEEEIGPVEPGHPLVQVMPYEAEAIREVAKALIEENISWPEAARRLSKLLGRGGRKDKEGEWLEEWTPNGVSQLFACRSLTGEIKYGDFKPCTCEAILSPTQYEQINGRRVTRNHNQDAKHFGAELLRCSGCRYTLKRHNPGKSGGRITFQCRTKDCPNPVHGEAPQPILDALKALAFAAHEEEFGQWEAIGVEENGRSIEDVDHDLDDARTRKTKFARLLREDPDDEDMKQNHDELKVEIRELEAERAVLENRFSGSRAAFIFPDMWESLETWEQIAHVRSVLEVAFLDAGGAPISERLHAFAHGTYPHKMESLPKRGRWVPLASFDPADVPLQLGVPAPARVEKLAL